MYQYFEYIDAKSSLFWEITLYEDSISTRKGMIGFFGTAYDKKYTSAAAAQREYNKRVSEKLSQGFIEKPKFHGNYQGFTKEIQSVIDVAFNCLFTQDYTRALPHFDKALTLDPNHWFALYGKGICLTTLFEHPQSAEEENNRQEGNRFLERFVTSIPKESIWPAETNHDYTRVLLRFAYNRLAWNYYLDAKTPEEWQAALALVEEGLSLTDDRTAEKSLFFMLDTKVRILLKLHQEDKAFEVVKHVLEKDSSFVDFQDFLKHKKYLLWLEKQA